MLDPSQLFSPWGLLFAVLFIIGALAFGYYATLPYKEARTAKLAVLRGRGFTPVPTPTPSELVEQITSVYYEPSNQQLEIEEAFQHTGPEARLVLFDLRDRNSED